MRGVFKCKQVPNQNICWGFAARVEHRQLQFKLKDMVASQLQKVVVARRVEFRHTVVLKGKSFPFADPCGCCDRDWPVDCLNC